MNYILLLGSKFGKSLFSNSKSHSAENILENKLYIIIYHSQSDNLKEFYNIHSKLVDNFGHISNISHHYNLHNYL